MMRGEGSPIFFKLAENVHFFINSSAGMQNTFSVIEMLFQLLLCNLQCQSLNFSFVKKV